MEMDREVVSACHPPLEIVLNRPSRVLSAGAVLATVTLLSVAPAAAQNWKAAPLYETLTLSAGFMPDPVSRALQAGGADSNPIDGTGCAGYINADRPDYDLNYTAGSSSLYIYARAGSDITLLVKSPTARGKPINVTSSLSGRNTAYGYDPGVCSPTPAA